jgi:hypothetical protein
MPVWWFGHVGGDQGVPEISSMASARRCPTRARDGSVAPGAQIAGCEYLGRNPDYMIETISTIANLDEGRNLIRGGVRIPGIEHVFTKTVDVRLGLFLSCWFPLSFRRKGPDMAQAQYRRDDTLENFLPQLYKRDAKHESVDRSAVVSSVRHIVRKSSS